MLIEIRNFNSKVKPRNPENKQKENCFSNVYSVFDSRERVLDAFQIKIFQIKNKGTGFSDLPTRDKVSQHSNLKILSPTKMLGRLLIVFKQVKPGKIFENLLKEIKQIVYSLYGPKETYKTEYENIIMIGS